MIATTAVLEPTALDDLVETLRDRGFRVVGPQVRDGAIVYDDLERAADLPAGWGDEQGPASYRLRRRRDEARFGFASSPHSWKQFLFPAHIRVWSATRPLDVEEEPLPSRPLALFGARACDLRAIEVQDRVFLEGAHVDRDYAGRRAGMFVVGVECTDPSTSCFCTSTGYGPAIDGGADLVLTELLEPEHVFVARAQTVAGREVLRELPHREAHERELEHARTVVAQAAARITRKVDLRGAPAMLAHAAESPRWEAIAERCLACANCTLVCPTCFCSAVEDATDLSGETAERTRSWASCFGLDHSHIHGGSVRVAKSARYRQWLTHKFATWEAQFGVSGCVGCGRCITWCPAAIDVTEELDLLRLEEDTHARS